MKTTLDSAAAELRKMLPRSRYNWLLTCHPDASIRVEIWVFGRVAAETTHYSWKGRPGSVMRDVRKWHKTAPGREDERRIFRES